MTTVTLKPIVAHTPQSREHYDDLYEELQDSFGYVPHINELAHNYTRCAGYAHYYVTGFLNAEALDLLSDDLPDACIQLAMAIDCGFSWFGGTSTIDPETRSFTVKVYTD